MHHQTQNMRLAHASCAGVVINLVTKDDAQLLQDVQRLYNTVIKDRPPTWQTLAEDDQTGQNPGC